jgi:hypothetical protein
MSLINLATLIDEFLNAINSKFGWVQGAGNFFKAKNN